MNHATRIISVLWILCLVLFLVNQDAPLPSPYLYEDISDTAVGCVYDCLDPVNGETDFARLDDNFTLTIREGE